MLYKLCKFYTVFIKIICNKMYKKRDRFSRDELKCKIM